MTGTNAIEMMISDITVDSHHAEFSIFPARRAGTYASIYIYKYIRIVLSGIEIWIVDINNKEISRYIGV